MNRVGAEPQVRDRARAGLLRVIHEVALRVEIGFLANDLDGVFVGAHGAVRAEAEEHGVGDLGVADEECGVNVEVGMGDIIHNADSEAILGRVLLELIKDRLDHGGGELLGGEAVAAADHLGHGRERAIRHALGESGEHILVERLAIAAGLLRAVEHTDGLDGLGQRRKEIFGGKRPVQAHDDGTDFFALLLQHFDGFQRGFRARAHQHDYPLGIRRADVVKGPVLAAGQFGKLIHRGGHDVRAGLVELVGGFAALEIHIRILRRAADERLFGIERPRTMVGHELVADHGADDIVRNHFDFADFVRGAEAIKEMQERHPSLQRGGLGNQGGVEHFLHAIGGQHGPADLPAGHHVLMVAKNGQRRGRQRARRNVEHGRGQLTRDLIHIGDHQQEALRGGEGGRQRTGLQRTVNRARRAAFGLHFHHGGHRAPDVGFAFAHPFIGPFAHVGGGRNWINGGNFRGLISDVGGGFIAVNDGDLFLFAHAVLRLVSKSYLCCWQIDAKTHGADCSKAAGWRNHKMRRGRRKIVLHRPTRPWRGRRGG
ncbi:MAG: hypothetical protein BWX54_01657 [Verrucomicrobia bacterium ADurb.Bin018]|nr:MAG: hypothetical protein BWX54_01657 [Verrucomicrobia bacterium ADurb.Bin018]